MVSSEMVSWAAAEAERLLWDLGERWEHSVAVAERARDVASKSRVINAQVLVAAAYVHDIGYATGLIQTGHHGIDGARHLRTQGYERLARLVAHHSGASAEAAVRGLEAELAAFPAELSPTADALTYCDVSTAHDGRPVALDERVAGVVRRYGRDHEVTEAVRCALPDLRAAVVRTEALLSFAPQAMTG